MPVSLETDPSPRKESISFLKKRNKKILLLCRRAKHVSRRAFGTTVAREIALTDKSFLFLFFKKEMLPTPCLPSC
jgi:hypothetical protein